MKGSSGRAYANRFDLGFYFQDLTRMLGSPGQFFGELPQDTGYKRPFGFLLISSLFFVGASLTQAHDKPWFMAAILLLNALGMTFITAGVGFMVMGMIRGRREPFPRIFAVCAYSSGVTMLASWIPLFVWITEPWKWTLISIGMVRSCGLSWKQTILVMGISIFIIVLFFWSVMPVILYLRGSVGYPS